MDDLLHISTPWLSQAPRPLVPLRHDATADVCIIGAGVSGLSVAYELALRGASVVVLDEGAIGCGQTGNTTAHLVTALDERYFEIDRLHNSRAAALARESHAAAIDRIESIVRSESIDCGFTRLDGYLFVPPNRRDKGALLSREFDAATRAGALVERLAFTPGSAAHVPCLRFPRQAQLHPLLYLDALDRAILARGGEIYTGSRVASVAPGDPCIVFTADHFRVRADAVVVATNTPTHEPAPGSPSATPLRSFVVALQLPTGAMAPALYWDGYWDENIPYHYVRLARSGRRDDHDLLLVGGEDQEVTSAADAVTPEEFAARTQRLHDWARMHFPSAGPIVHRWHGRILEPPDEFASIGRRGGNEDNVFVVSGDSGNGITYAAIAGLMLPDLISGRGHPWSAIYSPTRRARPPALGEHDD